MRCLLRRAILLITGLTCVVALPVTGDAQSTAQRRQPTRNTPGGSSLSSASEGVVIPGPLHSFERMAGISQKIPSNEVLPLLARNVFMQGFNQQKPTEFLLLLARYIQQARELQILAGPSGVINVRGCGDAGTLLQILGYRIVGNCRDRNLTLATSNPDLAFLTIDSGFPLVTLEECLQKGIPFNYAFPSTKVPVLLRESEWLSLNRRLGADNLIDLLLRDPATARLYWAMSRNDDETNLALARAPGLGRLAPYAAVLDFYGSEISIRSGHVIVPGGQKAEAAWGDLAGASPENASEFVMHLIERDNGWLAAYYDALSRVSQAQQEHLTEPDRLKRVYEGFRAPQLTPAATASVFRKAPGLLILFTRIEWDQDGQPHVPGDLGVWKEALAQKSDFKTTHIWAKRARGWNSSEQLLEAMASLSRIDSDDGPLQNYLTLMEIDGRRPEGQKLSPATAKLMANNFAKFGSWYLIFSEFPQLNDEAILRFISVTQSINDISNETLRGNAVGAFQATIGIWQILARQGEIPPDALNDSWMRMVGSFTKISSSTQLFDVARASLADVIKSTGSSDLSQEGLIELMAGPPQQDAEGQRVRQEIAGRIRNVLEDQRLVSLDTLFALSDGLAAMAQGSQAQPNLLSLAGELREFELPRPIFTNSEKITWAPGVYSTHHAELQIKTDLTRVIKESGTKSRLEASRGQLAPFLRDALVGLNYAYYEPPGAQVLHNNSLFVRSHDFSGLTIVSTERSWMVPELMGVGTPAGGGAYLMGSLADLPYALAATEQDFIAPENVQALIWKELVPDLLVSATVPRWWNVTPREMRAAALYQSSGEELLMAAERDAALRLQVIRILSDRIAPQRLETLGRSLASGEDSIAVLSQTMPADTFYLSTEFRRRYPGRAAALGTQNQQLDTLCAAYPSDTSVDRLSRDFGVPHPVLARNYAPGLLYVKPFPSFGGESSRLFGESWESSNLYWARLADEQGYEPAALNRLVPELTRRMTAKIFATDLEDWPAVQRAMLEAGVEFREGKVAPLPNATTTTALQAPVTQPQGTAGGGIR
ncbi:MAG TPA: hypothetical protein VFS41_01955 [Edaphobacter sp.]|nr:hypothetical protein [Edaphobacter sp.]